MRKVGPASPEPARPQGLAPAAGTAAQDPAAAPRQPLHATATPEQPPRTWPHDSDDTGDAGRTVRVTVVDEQDIPIDAARLAALAGHVLTALEVPNELELSVTCVTVEAMTALNTKHMGSMGPTDVLAFPIDAPADVTPGVPGLLGDVVLCPAVAHSQAVDHDRGPADEIDLLLVHGILHLLGHDHAGPDERRVMFNLTDDLLGGFGTAPGAER